MQNCMGRNMESNTPEAIGILFLLMEALSFPEFSSSNTMGYNKLLDIAASYMQEGDGCVCTAKRVLYQD